MNYVFVEDFSLQINYTKVCRYQEQNNHVLTYIFVIAFIMVKHKVSLMQNVAGEGSQM